MLEAVPFFFFFFEMFNVLSFLSFTKSRVVSFFFIVVPMSSCFISIDKIERII